MSDEKKDLTGLMDLAKKAADESPSDSTVEPAMPALEEQPIETIDTFESLEEFGRNHPPSESAPSDIPGISSPAEPVGDFASLEPTSEPLDDPFAPLEPSDSASPASFETNEPNPLFGSSAESDFLLTPQTEEQVPAQRGPTEEEQVAAASVATPTSKATPSTLEKVKQFSESITPSTEAVPAAFPFSLLITGKLAPEEQARLVDLISRENMGIREIDLEPQFASGKVLIPRISEYAGVMIVSALRSSHASIRLGPSDTIFATEETREEGTSASVTDESLRTSETQVQPDTIHPAEMIPVTTASQIAQIPHFIVIDIVTASATLRSRAVEAEQSPEYGELIEALTRELKYKAHRKGASAILNFNVELTQLSLASSYRVLVTGSAIKAAAAAGA